MSEETGDCGLIADICCDVQWAAADDEQKARALPLARAALHALSGHRVAFCPVVEYPCAPVSTRDCDAIHWYPLLNAGVWSNRVCGQPECANLPGIDFGQIAEVIEIVEDGQVVDDEAYVVDDGIIRRVDGAPWMYNVDLSAPSLKVTYRPGMALGLAGEAAYGALACEFLKLCQGSKDCRLPPTMTRLTLRGASYELGVGAFPGMVTGLPAVDTYILSINPYKQHYAARVWA